jgi:small subunit ribosomal protein S2
MVDTNSDPTTVDFPIPANDDASKSISLIVDILCKSIEEGLGERKIEKEKEDDQKKSTQKETKAAPKRVRSVKVEESEPEKEAAPEKTSKTAKAATEEKKEDAE